MKTTFRTAIIALMGLAIGITSCRKDAAVEPAPVKEPYTPRLMKIEMGRTTINLNYNDHGYLNFFKMGSDNYRQEYYFNYEANTDKLTVGVYGDKELTFNYDGDKLGQIDYRQAGNAENPVLNYTKFNYANGRISEMLNYYTIEGQMAPWGKSVYTYYANGDLKSDKYYYLSGDGYTLVERTEYEYDDKANALEVPEPLYYILGMPKSAHNVKKLTTYNMNNMLNETKTYSLNYNGANRPINGVESTTYVDSPPINKNYKYSYQ
ncbi:hypothetical protein [Mucilaginibacter myungsuensis]|uniref:YD repeat-containing protein n=1 Tax=Mucilaginibacter myungsuensis TaxID=649104 RepID=A0A929KWY0_9SPHI|nr:hypothetical protein [Mucilaginibacter myungsuensis]MBE9662697.1 hypothetical protein [Mucilaginibacter myungsuensis]MDN3598117.1 hypothetical protein [Mucilaginibacter myungsuensis]